MDVEQVKSDYQAVRDLVRQEVFVRDINPIRCHEMAYLINAGMNQRNYDSLVEDGIYKSEFSDVFWHSWVMLKGSWGRLNGIILDFQFAKSSAMFYMVFQEPTWSDKVVTSWGEKRRYKRRKIHYDLADGIEELAEKLFSEQHNGAIGLSKK